MNNVPLDSNNDMNDNRVIRKFSRSKSGCFGKKESLRAYAQSHQSFLRLTLPCEKHI